MAAKKKKKNSPEKALLKQEKVLMAETAANSLLVNSGNFSAILDMDNKAGYITGDLRIDAETVFNLTITEAGISPSIKSILNGFVSVFTELTVSKDKKPLYNRLFELSDQIVKKLSKMEYIDMSRRVYLCSSYAFSLSPLFEYLDYLYFPGQLLLGDDGEKPITQNLYLELYGRSLTIPFCQINTITNPQLFLSNENETINIIANYAKAIRISSDFFKEDSTVTTNTLCAISDMYSSLSCFNKFGFEEIKQSSSSDMIYYAVVARNFAIGGENVYSYISNLFISTPKDIFTHRKYILGNVSFGDLEIGFSGGGSEHSSDIAITNIRICEKHVARNDNDYFMVYLQYSLNNKNYRRIVPILIDDFHATLTRFNLLDYYMLFFLLGVYGLLDEIPAENKNKFVNVLIGIIKQSVLNIRYIDSETKEKTHASEYHQKKEVMVEAFVRKLPAGQTASIQAKELARKYRVTLDAEHTIVSPYIRNKGKDKS